MIADECPEFHDVTLAAHLAELHDAGRGGRARRRVRPVALVPRRVDAVIAGLLFMAGMRRSEVSALRWADLSLSRCSPEVVVLCR